MEKDFEIYRGKKERVKSIALKAKKDSSDDETSTSEAMTKNMPWPENDAEDKTNDETCLMAQSSNEVTLNSSYHSDDASSLDNDSMQIEYDSLCEISLKIINKNKILKTKRDLLEKEILELNEKIKKLESSKEIEIACLGFDDSKASTSGTKNISFVGSSAEKATDGSTIKVHGSTLPGSKLIHNSIDESKKPSLKPSPKSGIGYVKTESRSKTPPPRRNISSQPRYNTPQSRRNSRQPDHQNFTL
ncbi:hypothetical protein Tco_1500665 [Tanacetum coccineum]